MYANTLPFAIVAALAETHTFLSLFSLGGSLPPSARLTSERLQESAGERGQLDSTRRHRPRGANSLELAQKRAVLVRRAAREREARATHAGRDVH